MKRPFIKRKENISKFYISRGFNDTAYLQLKRFDLFIYKKNGDIEQVDYSSLGLWNSTFNLIETTEEIAKKNLMFKITRLESYG